MGTTLKSTLDHYIYIKGDLMIMCARYDLQWDKEARMSQIMHQRNCVGKKLYTSEHLHNNTMDTHASTVTTFQRIHTDTWPLVCTGTFPAKKILLFASHSSPAGHRGIVRYLSHHRLHHYVHCPSSFLAMWSPSER